jgi:hypothetical protein
LEDLESEELDDLMSFEFVKIAGQDLNQRAVVIIVAVNLQKAVRSGADETRILLCFMKVMEHLRCRPFVLVYCNSACADSEGSSSNSDIESEITLTIFDLFSARYKENLMQLFILHASFFFRMYMWVALPFLATP